MLLSLMVGPANGGVKVISGYVMIGSESQVWFKIPFFTIAIPGGAPRPSTEAGGQDMDVEELQVGMIAPDFTLPSSKGDITLSELNKSKSVVLAFYDKDNTPISLEGLTLFQDEYSVFEYLEAEILGISVDPLEPPPISGITDLPFPLISDPSVILGKLYGVLDKERIRYQNAVYVVDRWANIALKIPAFHPGDQGQYLEILQALGLNVLGGDL